MDSHSTCQVDLSNALKNANSEEKSAYFSKFSQEIHVQSDLRNAITSAYRKSEQEAVSQLIEQTQFNSTIQQATHDMAYALSKQLREQKKTNFLDGLVQNLLQEFSLSSQEGISLMCLAEALLRIPDKRTRNALIRDKINKGDWKSHLGQSNSLFVNAATWGLVITGKIVSTYSEKKLSTSLSSIVNRGGEPLIRKGMDMVMRLMGEQFVTGQTIEEALTYAKKHEEIGFLYSYDMLGEAAMNEADAQRYMADYISAIHAIGKDAKGKGVYASSGISIKLSAIHARYSRAQYSRVIDELYPRLLQLVELAKDYNIGINIDAEETNRLEISLDLLERLCFEPSLQGWEGIGFVIQAYQKRCPYVIDYLIDLAKRSHHRLMIRLVKGAYWDSEVKLAQLDGQEDYPVYTRKVHTDISYLACARKLLSALDVIFPQFATHNAYSLSAIYQMAGEEFHIGKYEFQCLHGMGEPMYSILVDKKIQGDKFRPCRIYAPVGTHETLLAYLVRRLLENGANTSFVNQIARKDYSIEALIKCPIQIVQESAIKEGALGLHHPMIPFPKDLFGRGRKNACGMDLSNEHQLQKLATILENSSSQAYRSHPILKQNTYHSQTRIPVKNPADHDDIVGYVIEANAQDIEDALYHAAQNYAKWSLTPIEQRATTLEQAADIFEQQMPALMGLLVREAGKTFNNAISEVRETIDFLRFYAYYARTFLVDAHNKPLGPLVCISPWNFPLAIFTGQISAALVTGNTVIAKPAEQTPLIAAQAIQILHQAGIPKGVLQLLPGLGETVGASLINDKRIMGALFTGSNGAAKSIQKTLASRLTPQGKTLPFIAETGGMNAMIMDSSALTEQVINDVIISAFDSAGQRCSALRILCIQNDVKHRTLEMLKGAMAEYRLANPCHLASDIGPVIDIQAKDVIEKHITEMRNKGFPVFQASYDNHEDQTDRQKGTFIQPTLIEIPSISELKQEIFGPVLHILTYNQGELVELLNQINHCGYGLTFGVHTRINETIEKATTYAKSGNQYVNRNIVGAVVGVQPFGGEGLSGTGPKAGGPLYLPRLLTHRSHNLLKEVFSEGRLGKVLKEAPSSTIQKNLSLLKDWAQEHSLNDLSQLCLNFCETTPAYTSLQFIGPTGEDNRYFVSAKEKTLCFFASETDGLVQLAAIIAVDGHALWVESTLTQSLYAKLPEKIQSHILLVQNWQDKTLFFDSVLYHGSKEQLLTLNQKLSDGVDRVILVEGYLPKETDIHLERLLKERSVSINTAAAGGNAYLMTID